MRILFINAYIVTLNIADCGNMASHSTQITQDIHIERLLKNDSINAIIFA